MTTVVDAPYISRSTVRRLETHVRKLRADLDALERFATRQRLAHIHPADLSDADRWFLWCRTARLAAVRAEHEVWAETLAWARRFV